MDLLPSLSIIILSAILMYLALIKYKQWVFKQDVRLNNERRSLKLIELKKVYQPDIAEKLINGEYWTGMDKVQLFDSMGEPTSKEKQTLINKTKDIWVYGTKSRGITFVFENNLLTKITEK